MKRRENCGKNPYFLAGKLMKSRVPFKSKPYLFLKEENDFSLQIYNGSGVSM